MEGRRIPSHCKDTLPSTISIVFLKLMHCTSISIFCLCAIMFYGSVGSNFSNDTKKRWRTNACVFTKSAPNHMLVVYAYIYIYIYIYISPYIKCVCQPTKTLATYTLLNLVPVTQEIHICIHASLKRQHRIDLL
eukprot:TRINITY_DN17646_c1_g1_i2.p1 TRINITY_DN17646_c1_g1~~TRINITY_DN17646_c1_g1_i2.p1  ORF type:complete len:134 (+),score=1.92 TRINITY_DN17646_c1_g1_i2:1610-2011(+)